MLLPNSIATTSPTEASNSASASATFTATATCSDASSGQTPTLQVISSDENVATVAVSGNTVTTTFVEANNDIDKKQVVITVEAKVGGNVVATETVTVYQKACALTIAPPTITADATSINLEVTSPSSDLHDKAITITAKKDGSDFTDFTVGAATYDSSKTTIPITLTTAATSGEKYQFTVKINDAEGSTSELTVPAP